MTGKWNMKRVEECALFSSITRKGAQTDEILIHGKHLILLNRDRYERSSTECNMQRCCAMHSCLLIQTSFSGQRVKRNGNSRGGELEDVEAPQFTFQSLSV
ncbi:hypothetical protein QQF64_016970 [Cirrhinus molitorella]|uniref:Uncharacterized protein n=1 Tax=Cirrhinus molitorella TaxID=172907 RepID=A0ABR3LRV6_9TELE